MQQEILATAHVYHSFPRQTTSYISLAVTLTGPIWETRAESVCHLRFPTAGHSHELDMPS